MSLELDVIPDDIPEYLEPVVLTAYRTHSDIRYGANEIAEFAMHILDDNEPARVSLLWHEYYDRAVERSTDYTYWFHTIRLGALGQAISPQVKITGGSANSEGSEKDVSLTPVESIGADEFYRGVEITIYADDIVENTENVVFTLTKANFTGLETEVPIQVSSVMIPIYDRGAGGAAGAAGGATQDAGPSVPPPLTPPPPPPPPR